MAGLSSQCVDAYHILWINRFYWLIKTDLHFYQYFTFREDYTRLSRLHATRNIATTHNTILRLYAQLGLQNSAQTRRFFDAHPEEAFTLLLYATFDFEKAIRKLFSGLISFPGIIHNTCDVKSKLG